MTDSKPREGWLELSCEGTDSDGREFMQCDLYFEDRQNPNDVHVIEYSALAEIDKLKAEVKFWQSHGEVQKQLAERDREIEWLKALSSHEILQAIEKSKTGPGFIDFQQTVIDPDAVIANLFGPGSEICNNAFEKAMVAQEQLASAQALIEQLAGAFQRILSPEMLDEGDLYKVDKICCEAIAAWEKWKEGK